jgi:hypothetical protein
MKSLSVIRCSYRRLLYFPEPEFVSVYEPRNRFQRIDSASLCGQRWARICKRLWSPGIDSEESISPAYVACRAGTTNRVVVPARQSENRFFGSIKGLQIRALVFVVVLRGEKSIPGIDLESRCPCPCPRQNQFFIRNRFLESMPKCS